MIDNLLLDTLRRGGTILYPTDTVWGLGCDATNADAIEKIYRIKQRDHTKSMLLLCAGEEMVRRYVPAPSEDALQLLLHSDRPTTVIFPHAVGLADNLTAADGSIAIRVPRANAGVTDSRGAEFCHELLLAWDRPIVSTSANLSGEPSPTCYNAIDPALFRLVDYAVAPSMCSSPSRAIPRLAPSRIVRVADDGSVTTLRP